MRLLFRTAWPPGLAVIGSVPTLVARHAVDQGNTAVSGGQPIAVLVIVVFVLVCGWVRKRDDIAAWWKTTSEAATAPQKERTQ